MLGAFIFWSIIAFIFVVIGIISLYSKKPVAFFANSKAPEVNDIKKFNKGVAKLWFGYAFVLELMGIPLIFCDDNKLLFIIPILGTVYASIGLVIVYMKIEDKYRK